MSIYILTINGVERPLRLGTLNLNTVVNGRHVLSCAVLSEEGAYRPTVAQEAELTEDGTPIFGGVIRLVEEEGADGLPIDHISSRITADSYNILAERRFVTETIPAGSTLKQVLQILDDYLTDYGVTLDAGQVTGPTLDAEWNIYGELLASVLSTLAQRIEQLTGQTYIWEIDPSKTFRMYEPGTNPAPVNFIDGDGNATGDIQVTRTRDKYVNRVVVNGGKPGLVDIVDTFTGDGVTDTFTLSLPIAGPFPTLAEQAAGYGVVDINGYESLATDPAPPAFMWEYDPVANTISTQIAATPTLGQSFQVRYQAQFPIIVTAEDASEIALNGIYEAAYEYPDVYDKAVLQQLAESLLSQGLEIKVELTLQTRVAGVLPGQSVTITAADRAINGDFLITEVNARTEATTDTILRTLKCVEGSVFKGSFRGLIKAWLGSGGSSVSNGPAPAAGGGFPHPPQRAVQVFRDGQFYATDAVKVSPAYTGLMIGADLSDAGDYNLLVGQGHTVN